MDHSSWNAITMFEVLEHVDNPILMIQRATDLLSPGGVIYLTTPNYFSIDRLILGSKWNVFHPEHVVYFSTKGLVRLVAQHEPRLQLMSVESNNISPQLFDFMSVCFSFTFFNRSCTKSLSIADDQISYGYQIDF